LLFIAFGQNGAAIRSPGPVVKWWELPPEDKSMYTEAAQMSFTNESLSEKDDFKIHLREVIRYTLPNLPIDSFEKIADVLISSGVTQLSDMSLVSETDLANVLKPIQARRLVYPFRKDKHKGRCPDLFFSDPSLPNNCFSVIGDQQHLLNWEEATMKCRQMHPLGRLAMIDSKEKSDAIKWIGLYHNPQNCHWTWHSLVRYRNNFTSPWYHRTLNSKGDGYCERPANYFNWLRNEPNFLYNNEFCVQLRILSSAQTHQDNDIDCWVTACGLCEVDVW
jgi:hypothetical protein